MEPPIMYVKVGYLCGSGSSLSDSPAYVDIVQISANIQPHELMLFMETAHKPKT